MQPKLDGTNQTTDPAREPSPTDASDSPEGTAYDPFSPERLRLSDDLSSSLGVKKLHLTTPVRKPDRQTFLGSTLTQSIGWTLLCSTSAKNARCI